MFCLDDLAAALSRLDLGARPALVCTENTHNFGGGRVCLLGYLKEIKSLASKRGAKVHLDGARIFNASVRSGIPVAKYAATADSLMFCLSKGLCAPVGSMLCGDREFIGRARRFRERIGGMLKQAGPLAAAGVIALTKMVPRLKKDHENTARFAAGLHAIKGIDADLDIEDPETNMLFVTLKRSDGDRFVAALDRMGIRCYHLGGGRIRFAVHRGTDAGDVERAVEVCRILLRRRGDT
jgi:threonine aldolase